MVVEFLSMEHQALIIETIVGIPNSNVYLFCFLTPMFIRYLWQLKTVVFLHRCQICAILFCDFSLNKGQKTHVGPMLPPGDRNWQRVYPN